MAQGSAKEKRNKPRNLIAWNFKDYRVGFNLMWEEIWTLPKRSNMLYAGLYVERKLW